jgi:toxin CcdB
LVIRQFDVFANPDPDGRARVPYIVVLQTHLVHDLDTVVVAPLIDPQLVQADGKIGISVPFDGGNYTLAAALLTHIRRNRLTTAVGTLKSTDYEIRRALDRLFTGF